MEDEKYKKLLGSINIIEPPKGLEGRILARINMEEKRLAKVRTWIFGGSSLASFGLSAWAIVYLVESIKQSGFWQYLSLAFSDGTALAYSKELSLSLVESLPIVSTILFLSAVGFFIWSFASINFINKFNHYENRRYT